MTANKKGSAQQTLQMIECGNLDLNFPIKYGTLLLGKTKRGKTTSAHYLMHQVLKGGYNDHNSIVYILDNGQARFLGAKIGQKQSQSQTQIPNFFDYQEDNQKKFLIDCPGYLDSFGCYRIISNRFFHYQVFSKVQNIRFIVTFAWNDMQWTADSMFQAFRQFLTGFSNLDQIEDKLINATCILITSVPDEKDLKSVRQKYKSTSLNIGSQFQKFYQILKENLLKKQKIFMFKKAKLGQYCDTQNNLFKQINISLTYWERKVDSNGVIDMKNIKISLVDYLQKDKGNFNNELTQLKNYYIKHFQSQIQNLVSVIKQLISDNKFNSPAEQDSCKFIQKIKQMVIQKQKWRKSEQSKCLFLYQKYQEKRKKIKQMLFQPFSIVSEQNISDVPFWLLKLSSLYKIEKICKQMAHDQGERQIQKVDENARLIKNILQILIALTKSKKIKDDNIKNSLALDFAYQVYKVIQISNKIYRLVKTTTSESTRQSTNELRHNMQFLLVSYPVALRSLSMRVISKNSADIFIENMNKINMQNLNEKGSMEVSKFLSLIQDSIQNAQNTRKLDQSELAGLNQNIDTKIAKLNANALAFVKKSANISLDFLFKIEQERQKIVKKIIQANQNASNNERLKGQYNRVVHAMAECLLKNSKFELALQVYESLFDADKIFEIMDIKQQKLKKQKQKQKQNTNSLLEHYIDYMNRARKYHRKELAIKKAQKAFHIAQETANLQKIGEISNFIREVSKNRELEQDFYYDALLKQIVQANLQKQLIQKILHTARGMSPIKKEKN